MRRNIIAPGNVKSKLKAQHELKVSGVMSLKLNEVDSWVEESIKNKVDVKMLLKLILKKLILLEKDISKL